MLIKEQKKFLSGLLGDIAKIIFAVLVVGSIASLNFNFFIFILSLIIVTIITVIATRILKLKE